MAMIPTKEKPIGAADELPPPPPFPAPVRVDTRLLKTRAPMARRGFGTKGNRVPILTNHFEVNVSKLEGHFFHYSVALHYEDDSPVDAKGVGRKILDRVQGTYKAVLEGKQFAYDGDKSLFTIGPLPSNKMELTVVLDEVTSARNDGNTSPEVRESADRKRVRRPYQSKIFKVVISYAAKVPMQAIANALRGQESENSQEALRVLDIILRQHAAKQGCLLVRQSFFHNDAKNFADVGGGVLGCRGFHSSFRTTQGGLSLNIDVSTTMIVQPGPVVDFLIANQGARDPFSLDWAKAKRTLKNLRVKTIPTNREYKITGLSERSCKNQLFTFNQRGEAAIELSVYDYFVKHRNIALRYSGDLPCINVGKPKKPTYIPIELCSLVSLQRYTKALTSLQRASLVEKSRQKPKERMSVLSNALEINNYDAEPMLRSCGVYINRNFSKLEGRVLPTPKLKVGNGEDLFARNGRWNFNNKRLVEACKIERWSVVNFSTRCNVGNLVDSLINVGRMKGVTLKQPDHQFDEDAQFSRAPPLLRVEKMCGELQSRIPRTEKPDFLLCCLPERKNCDIYGPWKRKTLSELGVVSQCVAPANRINDQYLTNLLLKINAKVGGLNSILASELSIGATIPAVAKVPTLIMGMDVSHGSPGSESPSIAAVVSSRKWPSLSRYRASVRTQSRRAEMIDSLFNPVSEMVNNVIETVDNGMMRELLLDFYASSEQRKPEHIIIFRDGVSETQFDQVLNIELNQIIEACKFLDQVWSPKFVVIVSQKNHHTKFFQPNSPDNVQPGTVIDNKICHPKNNDFYLCAHAGMIGTTRPTHYHILHDEVGFSADDLQELVHSLSYVFQRSTTAISEVAPIRYAHLAASQLGQWMKIDETSETSSSHNDAAPGAQPSVPPMPTLRAGVCNSMFFC